MNLPTGVEVHNGSIRITFIYRGIRCREVLRGWVVTNGNIKKAGHLRAMIVGEIQLGNFDYAERFPESKALKKFSSTQKIKTFGQLCEIFLASKSLEVAASSLENLQSTIATLQLVVGANTPIADIQHTDLLRYRAELLNGDVVHPKRPWLNKKGRAASTVNGIMNTFCTMLKLANRSQFIKHMPYEDLKVLKRSRKDPDPLLPSEYKAFIEVLPSGTRELWVLAINTGLRHGELCALAWEDIDLEKGELHVRRNISDKNVFCPPKTIAGFRTVTLLQPALDALREQFKKTGALTRTWVTYHHREHGKTEQQHLRFVFVPSMRSRKKSPHYAKTSLADSWKRGLKLAGLRYRVPYQSRHTFACWSLSAGANPSFIASQMGHENSQMVYEVYGKWIGEMNQNQVDMLNESFSAATPPTRPLCHFVHCKTA